MSNQSTTIKMINEVIFEYQRAMFVAMAHIKKAIPGSKEYWEAVQEYREPEKALENYMGYWGQPEKINSIR